MAPDSAADASYRRPCAVLLIANTAAPHSRGLCAAHRLVGSGWEVEIAAEGRAGVPPTSRPPPEVMRAIVEADRLGPSRPRRSGRPLCYLIEGHPRNMPRWATLPAASRGWHAWETTVQPYLELVERLGSAPVRV